MATLLIILNLVLAQFASSNLVISQKGNSITVHGYSSLTGKFKNVKIESSRLNPVVVTTDWD